MDQERSDDIAARELLGTESIRRFIVVVEKFDFDRDPVRVG
jgi:hypothetical protein